MGKQQKNVLVVAAHPDDEVLGCGATIARHTQQGDAVTVLILSEGVRARENTAEADRKVETLRREAETANDILGVQKLIIQQFPDQQFDTIPLLEIAQAVEVVMKKVRPQIVYSHHQGDVNKDHRVVAETMQVACRPLPDTSLECVYTFEVPSSTEWNFTGEHRFTPTMFFEATDFIEKKAEAMRAYRSELRDFPHPRSIEYLRLLAKQRGGQVGFHAAEAFELIYNRIAQT